MYTFVIDQEHFNTLVTEGLLQQVTLTGDKNGVPLTLAGRADPKTVLKDTKGETPVFVQMPMLGDENVTITICDQGETDVANAKTEDVFRQALQSSIVKPIFSPYLYKTSSVEKLLQRTKDFVVAAESHSVDFSFEMDIFSTPEASAEQTKEEENKAANQTSRVQNPSAAALAAVSTANMSKTSVAPTPGSPAAAPVAQPQTGSSAPTLQRN